ncbi:MAG: HesB-like protein [Sarcina sp.]
MEDKKVLMSEEAYNEFKSFLEENGVDEYTIRLDLAGYGCSGPAFNISVDSKLDGDIEEKVNDILFLIEESLIDDFGGFKILSSAENDGNGLALKPFIESEGGCGSCGGGCH